MPDSDDVEELGTFDSSGAFVSTKVGLYWQIWFRRWYLEMECEVAFELIPGWYFEQPEDLNDKDNQKVEESHEKPPSPETKDKEESPKQESKEKEAPKTSNVKVDKGLALKKQERGAENKTVINNRKAEPPQGKPKKEEVKRLKNDKTSPQENSAQGSGGDPIKRESAAQDRSPTQGAKKDSKTEKEKPRDQSGPPVKKGTTVSEVEREALDRLQDTAENMVLAAMTAEVGFVLWW